MALELFDKLPLRRSERKQHFKAAAEEETTCQIISKFMFSP